jgi:hypothetical protein
MANATKQTTGQSTRIAWHKREEAMGAPNQPLNAKLVREGLKYQQLTPEANIYFEQVIADYHILPPPSP